MRRSNISLAVAAVIAGSMGNAAAAAKLQSVPAGPAANEKGAQPGAPVIETDVNITVRVRSTEDVLVGDLVAQALLELIESSPATAEGDFETKAGPQVSWVVTHHEIQPGVPAPRYPIPVSIAHAEDYNRILNINGVRYALEAFRFLAEPREDALYRFRRNGDTVTVEEVRS